MGHMILHFEILEVTKTERVKVVVGSRIDIGILPQAVNEGKKLVKQVRMSMGSHKLMRNCMSL